MFFSIAYKGLSSPFCRLLPANLSFSLAADIQANTYTNEVTCSHISHNTDLNSSSKNCGVENNGWKTTLTFKECLH